MEAKEDIRSRLNIEDIVGEYVQLKRAGRNYKGLSPFSTEKTPSFVVSPEKHIWHDFSSNRGGDIFSFIMEVEGIDFMAAMELLARKAGVDLSQYKQQVDSGLAQKKERLYKLLELAAYFYQRCMIDSPIALEYIFKKRRLSKAVVQTFKIGYSPNADDNLLQFLLKRGYQETEIQMAGLITQRNGRLSDMFRGRMMVPLCDGQGRIVGFTARLIVDNPRAPKYINTPQTLLYDKGRQVFGFDLAKEAIRKTDYVVIVEGNLDVVSSHQAGVAQVVAAAGTALTEYHLRALSRLTSNVRLAFDRDKAGIAATERAISIASNLGIQLGIVTVLDGFKDPDELIQSDPQQWLAVLEQPQDAMEWLLDDYARRFDLATAEGKRRATTKALEIIQQLVDPVEQEHYLALLASRTNTSLAAIKAKQSNNATQLPEKKLKENKATISDVKDKYLTQDRLLALALMYPDCRSVLARIGSDDLHGNLRRAILQLINKLGERTLETNMLEKLQSDELRVKISELELIANHEFGQLTAPKEAAQDIIKRVLKPIKVKQKEQIIKGLDAEIDPIKRQAMFDKFQSLNKEIEQLK